MQRAIKNAAKVFPQVFQRTPMRSFFNANLIRMRPTMVFNQPQMRMFSTELADEKTYIREMESKADW